MTTTDELERGLRALAQGDDERFRLELRAVLAEQARPAPRRFRLGWSLAAAAAAAAAIGATVFLVGGSGGPSPAAAAILHHVRVAVTPPADRILHERVVGVQNGTTVSAEFWQETSPPYASLGSKGPDNGPRSEFADDGTTNYTYDASANTIYEQRDTQAPTFEDPISLIKQELDDGHAQYRGETTIDGTRVYAIKLSSGIVAYVDENSYRPLALDDPQNDGSVLRLNVAAFDYLPETPANLQLLSMTARHPSARIDTNPNDPPPTK